MASPIKTITADTRCVRECVDVDWNLETVEGYRDGIPKLLRLAGYLMQRALNAAAYHKRFCQVEFCGLQDGKLMLACKLIDEPHIFVPSGETLNA